MSRVVPDAPRTVYWELTRACGHDCRHCRVWGGEPLPDELSLDEVMEVAGQLVRLGPRLVVLTGGEPLMHPGWREVVGVLAGGGIRVRMFSGGDRLDDRTLRAALEAGVSGFAVSLDGPAAIHDGLRPSRSIFGGSPHRSAIDTIRRVLAQGADLRVVTAVNRENLPHLVALYETLCELGVPRWQLQLMQANGRAQDHRMALMIQPRQVEHVVELLMRAHAEKRINVPMHCSIGYLVPEEASVRHPGTEPPLLWRGSRAGLGGMSITARGEVLGCPCLPDEFATASVIERSLEAIWADERSFPYTRSWSPDVLEGECKACELAPTCRAGCLGVAYGATATVGSNPYCLRLTRGLGSPS